MGVSGWLVAILLFLPPTMFAAASEGEADFTLTSSMHHEL